jgi:STE24 endopeptidase
MMGLTLFNTVVALPFTIYKTFVIEERWGYNKTTAGTFVMDQIKAVIISAILLAIVIPLLLWTINEAGSALVPSLIGLSIALIIAFNIIIPVLILPMFYTFTDLDDGELKTAIFAEADKTGIPVS